MFNSKRITTMGGDKFRDEYSLAFDGSDDYIVVDGTNIDFGTNDFTLSLWFHPRGDNTATYFMSQHANNDNRWYFRLDSNGVVHFYSAIGGSTAIAFTGDAVVDANSWNHIVFSVDRDSSTGTNVYINGALDDTGDQSSHSSVDYNISTVSPDVAGREDFNIGRWSTAYTAAKSISEVAIYHTALSASQVKTLYNGREPYNHAEGIASNNLKGWWRMGDGLENGSGTTIYDMSDNTNNGTMNNMTADDFVGDTP